MDLREFEIHEGDYGTVKSRARAIEFLSGLEISEELPREEVGKIVSLADHVWFCEFTDDSGYIPGDIKFQTLNSIQENTRTKIIEYFRRKGNWIIEAHVSDYYSKRYLGSKSSGGTI